MRCGGITVKVTLQGMHCYKKTESDEDEIYCLVTTGGSANRGELARFQVGNFEVGRTLQPGKLLWDGTSWPEGTITVVEGDENEAGHGRDDVSGEVAERADGKCKSGDGR